MWKRNNWKTNVLSRSYFLLFLLHLPSRHPLSFASPTNPICWFPLTPNAIRLSVSHPSNPPRHDYPHLRQRRGKVLLLKVKSLTPRRECSLAHFGGSRRREHSSTASSLRDYNYLFFRCNLRLLFTELTVSCRIGNWLLFVSLLFVSQSHSALHCRHRKSIRSRSSQSASSSRRVNIIFIQRAVTLQLLKKWQGPGVAKQRIRQPVCRVSSSVTPLPSWLHSGRSR